MKKSVVFFFVLFLAFSCEKDKEPGFSGITERDIEGVLNGNVDDTDWRFDDVWNAKEESLFNEDNFITENSSQAESDNPPANVYKQCVAYPNPATSAFNLRIDTGADTVRFVIVDKNYGIIHAKKISEGIMVWMFDVSSQSEFSSNSVYRVYYKLDYLDGTVEKGHGDVMIKR